MPGPSKWIASKCRPVSRSAAPRRAFPIALVALSLVVALQAIIYTYDGWTGPLYFGEETRDPGRGIPRSMMLGVVLVILGVGSLATVVVTLGHRRRPVRAEVKETIKH